MRLLSLIACVVLTGCGISPSADDEAAKAPPQIDRWGPFISSAGMQSTGQALNFAWSADAKGKGLLCMTGIGNMAEFTNCVEFNGAPPRFDAVSGGELGSYNAWSVATGRRYSQPVIGGDGRWDLIVCRGMWTLETKPAVRCHEKALPK